MSSRPHAEVERDVVASHGEVERDVVASHGEVERHVVASHGVSHPHAGVESLTTALIRVAVADERQMIAEALAALVDTMPGFIVTAVLAGQASLSAIAAEPPHLVLAGVDAGSGAGFALVRSIRALTPELQIVIVADALQPEMVRFVFEQRLGGLLLTDMCARDIATSLDEVAHGRAVLPVGWQRMLADQHDDPLESLSERQLEVLSLLADGCSYEQIGARLFITLNTVKFHVRSIFERLGVGNRMAAARVFAERSAAAPARKQTTV